MFNRDFWSCAYFFRSRKLSLFSDIRRNYKFGKKINDFKKENEELFRIKETFNSQEFLEDEARRKLNMVKEGESVIIVAESNEPFLNELKVQTKTMSNLKLWLKYFFEK